MEVFDARVVAAHHEHRSNPGECQQHDAKRQKHQQAV
jgi:hypothetical protein